MSTHAFDFRAGEAHTAAKFVILRKEINGYSTRGPIARAMLFEKACAEIVRLKAQYPKMNFVLAAEIAEAVRTESITVVVENQAKPSLVDPIPRRQSRP